MKISTTTPSYSHLSTKLTAKIKPEELNKNALTTTQNGLTSPETQEKVELSSQVKKRHTSDDENQFKNKNSITSTKKITYSHPDRSKKIIEEPGIFLIGGFNFFGLGREKDGGLELLAKNIPGAQYFDWDQKGLIMKEITKRSPQQPIVLVGHSLGGDLAVEIANDLNRVENQFRKVNLLVTLDSFGFDNDIIPQNVEKNMNYIAETKMILNGSANVARSPQETWVLNDLRHEKHSELDNSSEIQRAIMYSIYDVTGAPTSDPVMDLSTKNALNDVT